jgi:adenine-specific DNA-methyltransferase
MNENTMDKLKMHSPNFVDQNIAKIAELFPNCVTESRNEKGELQKAIDFDLLKQELSAQIVEGPQERYQLNWPGKREALLTANAPIAKTLRPCREESVDFDTTQNLFIEGDNLDALKLLQETYLGKVKMIYIDPPYNTGKDFIYPDNFSEKAEEYLQRSNQKSDSDDYMVANTETNGRFHSDWISMLFSRLRLARNLLRDDGVIFCSIDDNEVHNLRKVFDEIFGAENFVANIIWHKRYAASNDAKGIPSMHDHILVYQKGAMFERKLLPRTEKQDSLYKFDSNDGRGLWRPDNLTVKTVSESYLYEIINPKTGKGYFPTQGRCWLTSKETMADWITQGRVYFGKDGIGAPQLKRYLTEVQQGLVPNTYWSYDDVGHTDSSRKELKKLFETSAPFDNPKPSALIKRILQISTNNGDIVLDFFAGSGTTADSVLQLCAESGDKYQFILVQIPELCSEKSDAGKAGFRTIAEITKERIRRAGKKIKEENADKEGIENLDIGFRVLKIDTSNMAEVYYNPAAISQEDLFTQVDNLKPDRTEEDLLFQVMLDWGVDLTLPIRRETIANKTVFFVAKNALVACFDKQGTIDDEFVKELAKHQPVRAVFRDAGFKDDSAKINVEQVFKLLSPITKVKTL